MTLKNFNKENCYVIAEIGGNFSDFETGKKLVDFFSQADPSLAINEIEYAGERMLYSRAYGFIKKIDLEDKYHQKLLREENTSKLKEAYTLAIKFYENEEEYARENVDTRLCNVAKLGVQHINTHM